MAYCFTEDCGDYAVTPMLVSAYGPVKCCESAPMCYPCLPRCPKGQVVYCCEKKPCGKSLREARGQEDCCSANRLPAPPEQCEAQYCCPTCNQPTCKPVKTKYVIPCYRYEDGRIEQYMPTRHGRLPSCAYRRNGMQDQIHGYRGAIRYLCAGGPCETCSVFTAIEPIRRLYPRVTQEVWPVKKRKDKKDISNPKI